MAESTLTLARTQLRLEAAYKMGFGRDSGVWTATEEDLIDKCVAAGLRMFYWPPPIDGTSREWTFLNPTAALTAYVALGVSASRTVTAAASATLVANGSYFYPEMVGRSIVITSVGTRRIVSYTNATTIVVDAVVTAAALTFSIDSESLFALPDHFGSITGPMQFDPTTNDFGEIQVTSDIMLRRLRMGSSDSTGRPYAAAIVPRAAGAGDVSGVGPQRFDLLMFPKPDGNYLLTYSYRYNPDVITSVLPYALGGSAHSQTIEQAIYAAWETKIKGVQNGPEYAAFLQMLATSISIDKRNEPTNIGSSNVGSTRPGRFQYLPTFTVNGVEPGFIN